MNEEEKRERRKRWDARYSETEQGKKTHREYAVSEKGKETQRKGNAKYSKTKRGKLTCRRKNSRRRTLGFIELNEPFPNFEGHHIDKEFIIYIPTEMHQSVRHNVHSGVGMEEINNLAIDFCYGH